MRFKATPKCPFAIHSKRGALTNLSLFFFVGVESRNVAALVQGSKSFVSGAEVAEY